VDPELRRVGEMRWEVVDQALGLSRDELAGRAGLVWLG
jgi:hypothetical protein